MQNNEILKMKSCCSYLINLDRAKERLANVRPLIEEVGFNLIRISAIDGNLLSRNEIEKFCDLETYRYLYKMYPEPGTIGCAMSHAKVWKNFIESHSDFALVFEDDVRFVPEQLKEAVSFCITNYDLWDFINLEVIHNGWPIKIFPINSGKYGTLSIYFANTKHSGCYLISKETARKFLKNFYPIKMPLDHYFTRPYKFFIKSLGIEPRLVKQASFPSQIKVGDAQKFENFSILLRNATANITQAIAVFIYNIGVAIFLKLKLTYRQDPEK